MGGTIKKIAVAAAALGAFSFLGAMDYSDALVQDAMEKEARPQRVIASYEQPALGFPLDYDAVICQAGKCRYYSRSKAK